MIRITHLLRMCFSNLMSCQSQPHRARSSQSLAQVWRGGGVVTGGFAVGCAGHRVQTVLLKSPWPSFFSTSMMSP